MYGYILTGRTPDDWRQHPSAARLRAAYDTWQAKAISEGVMLTPPGAPTARAAYGEAVPGIDGDDGPQFLPPTAPLSIHDLARPQAVPCIDVAMSCGVVVSVALATAAPQRLAVSARAGESRRAGWAGEFGRLAWELYDRGNPERGDGDGALESDAIRLAFLAMRQCYHLTEEACNFLDILSSTDLEPILLAVWGGDPKASAGGGSTSAPAPPAP